MVSRHTRTVLLVEDNPDDVELTLRAFEKAKFSNPVAIANDGVQALDYLLKRGEHAQRDRSTDPILVLLDLKLPKVDGHEVLRTIRATEEIRMTPVVILTSSVQQEDLVRGYTEGTNSYLRKPVRIEDFTELIRSLGLYWFIHNEPPPPLR